MARPNAAGTRPLEQSRHPIGPKPKLVTNDRQLDFPLSPASGREIGMQTCPPMAWPSAMSTLRRITCLSAPHPSLGQGLKGSAMNLLAHTNTNAPARCIQFCFSTLVFSADPQTPIPGALIKILPRPSRPVSRPMRLAGLHHLCLTTGGRSPARREKLVRPVKGNVNLFARFGSQVPREISIGFAGQVLRPISITGPHLRSGWCE